VAEREPAVLSTVAVAGRLVDELEHTPDAAEPLLAALAQLTSCDSALLAVVDGATGRHRLLANVGYPEAVAAFVVEAYPRSCPGYAFTRGVGLPVRMCDIPFDYRETRAYSEVLAPAGFHEGVTVPLRSGGGQYTGLLALSSVGRRPASAEALVALSALSPRLASVTGPHRAGVRDLFVRDGEVLITVATGPGRVHLPPGADDDLPLTRAELLAVARLTARSRRDRVGFFHQDRQRRWWAVRAQRTGSTGPGVPDVVLTAREQDPPHGLTARELEILTLMVPGLPNAEIAARLHASVSTVKTHVEHILAKLGSSSRAGAVGTASDHLLLSWPHLDRAEDQPSDR
jgi:DNA-binding CsgD family transcriptional regulator